MENVADYHLHLHGGYYESVTLNMYGHSVLYCCGSLEYNYTVVRVSLHYTGVQSGGGGYSRGSKWSYYITVAKCFISKQIYRKGNNFARGLIRVSK